MMSVVFILPRKLHSYTWRTYWYLLVGIGIFASVMAFNTNIILVLILLVVSYVAVLLYATTSYNEAQYRAFANQNGLKLVGNEDADTSFERVGLIFEIGNSYQVNNIIVGPNVMLCHLSYRALPIGGDILALGTKYDMSYHATVLSLELPAVCPHLVLDARWDRFHARANLLTDCEKIELEGDFPDYFTVFMQKGSSAEALSILSPDVMQRLIELDSTYSLELVGNRAIFVLEQDQLCDQLVIEKLYQQAVALVQIMSPRLLRMQD